MAEPADLHGDLVEWGVIEAEGPIRFTRRFRGALARAAAGLQAAEQGGQGTAGDPLNHQIETALSEFLAPLGTRAGLGHRAFVRAVHVSSLPEAVRRILGV